LAGGFLEARNVLNQLRQILRVNQSVDGFPDIGGIGGRFKMKSQEKSGVGKVDDQAFIFAVKNRDSAGGSCNKSRY